LSVRLIFRRLLRSDFRLFHAFSTAPARYRHVKNAQKPQNMA